MRVTVDISAQARHELLTLITARMPNPLDARLTAVFYAEEAMRVLRQHAATPPGAIISRRADGIWWLFAGGVWLAIEQQDRPGWLFRSPHRTFRIVAAAVQPPAA